MKPSIKVFQSSKSTLQNFLEWNPQLFREIRGRFKTKSVIVAAAISLIAQLVISLFFLGQLPDPISDPTNIPRQCGRYAFGLRCSGGSSIYETDLLNNWMINWQLLWSDIFVTLSITTIFFLLVVGTYMLVADTVKEESRGTLNFLRLTPQSASNILLGKILGVPVLLYGAVVLTLPLHLVSGLNARIPFNLIVGFDLLVIASCICFYSAALLWSLTNTGLAGFKPWFASGSVLLFLLGANAYVRVSGGLIGNDLLEGLVLFYPGTMLSYLLDATYIPAEKLSFLTVRQFSNLLFYGQELFAKASVGIGFALFNFGLCSYWLWSALKRRFHNPQSTLLSKTQGYGITACFVFVSLGFCLQTNYDRIMVDNFLALQCLLLIFFLGLIAALSPHRQALQDWARYRHQLKPQGNILWKEMVFGENSPSTVAIAINLLFTTAYIVPSVFFFSLADRTWSIFWGIMLGGNILLLYAVVAQFILTVKTRNPAIWATATILSLIVVPPVCFGFAEIMPYYSPGFWLFTFLPATATEYATLSTIVFSVLGQWLAIALVSLQMTKKLRQAGASETKMLLSK